MNTQLVAKEVKLTQWNALVQECMSSGLKVKDWCPGSMHSIFNSFLIFNRTYHINRLHNNQR